MDITASRKRIRDLEIDSLSWKTELQKQETLHETERLHWQEQARKLDDQVRSLHTERRLIAEKYEDCKEQLVVAKKQVEEHLKAKDADKHKLVRDLSRVTDELHMCKQTYDSEKNQLRLGLDQAELNNNVSSLKIGELEEQLQSVKAELKRERELRALLASSGSKPPNPARTGTDDFRFLRKQLTDSISRCKQIEEDNQKLKNENLRFLAMYQNVELLREDNISLASKLEHYEQVQSENIQLRLTLDQLKTNSANPLSFINDDMEREKDRDFETQLAKARTRIQELETIIHDSALNNRTQNGSTDTELAMIKQQLIAVTAENRKLFKAQELLQFKLQSKDDELKSMQMEADLDEEMYAESEVFEDDDNDDEDDEESEGHFYQAQSGGVIVLDSD